MNDIELIGMGISIVGFIVGGVVWLVRLEGKTVANSVAITATAATAKLATDAIDKRLDSHIIAQDKSREEIIRLQEQIKHLTDMIERWLSPAPRHSPGS